MPKQARIMKATAKRGWPSGFFGKYKPAKSKAKKK